MYIHLTVKRAESAERAMRHWMLESFLELSQLVKKGDFSVRMPVDGTGIAGKIYDALNDVIELNNQMTKECEKI